MEIISIRSKDWLEAAVERIEKGGVVAVPTDTAYGLAAKATDAAVVEKVYAIKGREKKHPLSVMVKDLKMAEEVGRFRERTRKLFIELMPGQVTLVVPAQSILPQNLLAGGETVAIRLIDHLVPKTIFVRIKYPLTATSANISGEGELYSAEEVWRQFEGRSAQPDLVIEAGDLERVEPSTMVTFDEKEEIKILREGPVSKAEIEAKLGK